jgi:hypothetical protein
VLGDPTVDHSVDLQAGEPDVVAGRRETAKGPGVRAGEQDALRDHHLVGRRVQHLEVRVREALEEDGEEFDPGFAVERGRLDALERVRDVVGGTGGGLGGVVTGVERVDPPAGDDPVGSAEPVAAACCGRSLVLMLIVGSFPAAQAGMPGGPRISRP